LNVLEDAAHHLSVLLLYAFRQQNSSSYWYSYAGSGILHYCDHTAGWMKTPLGTEVDLRAGHIVLDGFPALRERGTAPAPFLAKVYCGHGRPSQLLLSSCYISRSEVRDIKLCQTIIKWVS